MAICRFGSLDLVLEGVGDANATAAAEGLVGPMLIKPGWAPRIALRWLRRDVC
jgi:hypothetical protein